MWTVTDAKSQLSEVLRLARNGEPQVIGTQNPCVVISVEQFKAYQSVVEQGSHDGRWLLSHATGLDIDLQLPSRDADRALPVFDF